MAAQDERDIRTLFDSEARISWVLAATAGLVGAAAFTHTAGYFVTFMTGNTERAVLGYFRDNTAMSVAATLLLGAFLSGVVVASLCRRHFWADHPHAVTILTTTCLALASAIDALLGRDDVDLGPILIVAFGIGALNTAFVKDGEVSVPLSYVTGTVVKLGQGIERHISGGSITDWLDYFLLYLAFGLGAGLGGFLSKLLPGTAMLAAATVVCMVTTVYTYFHADRHGPLSED